MKISLPNEAYPDIGVTDAGQWVRRSADGWLVIDRPAWAVGNRSATKATAPVHPMADPYERQAPEIPLVTVRRTVTRTVPDYEAEVLVKEGWVIVASDTESTGRIPIGRLPRENVLQSDEAESSADTQGGT